MKEDYEHSISNCIGIVSALHYAMSINDLIRSFVDFHITASELIELTRLIEQVGRID